MSAPPQSLLWLLLPDMVCGDTQTSTSTPMSQSKDQIFIVCAEGMMSNQLHGIVLMVLLFDVLVSYGSF
jgi:hypothetical protein